MNPSSYLNGCRYEVKLMVKLHISERGKSVQFRSDLASEHSMQLALVK